VQQETESQHCVDRQLRWESRGPHFVLQFVANGYDAFGFTKHVQPRPPAPNYGNCDAVSNRERFPATYGLNRQPEKTVLQLDFGPRELTPIRTISMKLSNGGLFPSGFEGITASWARISPTSLRTGQLWQLRLRCPPPANGGLRRNPTFHKTGAMRWLSEGWQFSGKVSGAPACRTTISTAISAVLVINGCRSDSCEQ